MARQTMTRTRTPVPGTQAYARAKGLRQVVSLRMTKEQLRKLDAAARAEGVSRSEMVSLAVTRVAHIARLEARLAELSARVCELSELVGGPGP